MEKQKFMLQIHERLCAEYGCPVPYFHNLPVLDELISSLLSHRTKNHDSGIAFKTLKAKFPTWEEVRDGDVVEVQAAIRKSTWPEQKAPRIQAVLREITARRGELALDFLKDLEVKEARKWLQSIIGVGPKTSAATLLFSDLRIAALPVDSHHHRVAMRVGLIPANSSLDKAHELLEAMIPADWDAQKVFDNHEIFMFHGQRCCYFYRPECERCVLLDSCPTGQKLLYENSEAAKKPECRAV